MLQKLGLYKLKNNILTYKEPNPSDLTVSWGNMNDQMIRDFLGFWFETSVLLKHEVEQKIYGVNPIGYKQLLLLDHIGEIIRLNKHKEGDTIQSLLEDSLDEYGEIIDRMIALVLKG